MEVFYMFGLTPFNRRSNELIRKNDVWDLRNVFDEFFNDAFLPTFMGSGHPIKTDIRETEKEYIVDAEIPGVRKEDIKLDLRDDTLTILVEHNENINEERDNFVRKERRYGSYSRRFYVEGVKHEEVKAQYNNGVLTITLPKEEGKQDKKRNIEIQ